VISPENFEFKFSNITFKHSKLINHFAKLHDLLEDVVENYENYHFGKLSKEKKICRKERMNFSESDEFFSNSPHSLNLPLNELFDSFKTFSVELKNYLKQEMNKDVINLFEKFEIEFNVLTQLESTRNDSIKGEHLSKRKNSMIPSQNYFKDANLEILNMKQRSISYSNKIDEYLNSEINNFKNNNQISQEDAIESRIQLKELNEIISKLKEKIKDQKLEILRFQNELENCKSLNLSYEKECYDVFVKLQMTLQQYTELDVNQLIQLSNEENIVSSFGNFYNFVKNTIQHLQKELDRVNEERSKLQDLLTKTMLSKSNSSSNSALPDQEEISNQIIKEVRISPDDFFSSESVDREYRLKLKYETKINYLLSQIEACDLKSVDFRQQWQLAVGELEDASKIEKQLTIQLSHLRDILEQTQDELNTTRTNYENQIAILSLKLTSDHQ
jgi:hypothetical protein